MTEEAKQCPVCGYYRRSTDRLLWVLLALLASALLSTMWLAWHGHRSEVRARVCLMLSKAARNVFEE